MKSTVYLLGNVNYLTKNKSTILFFSIKALSFNKRVILLFLNYLTTLPSEPARLRHFQAFHHLDSIWRADAGDQYYLFMIDMESGFNAFLLQLMRRWLAKQKKNAFIFSAAKHGE